MRPDQPQIVPAAAVDDAVEQLDVAEIVGFEVVHLDAAFLHAEHRGMQHAHLRWCFGVVGDSSHDSVGTSQYQHVLDLDLVTVAGEVQSLERKPGAVENTALDSETLSVRNAIAAPVIQAHARQSGESQARQTHVDLVGAQIPG